MVLSAIVYLTIVLEGEEATGSQARIYLKGDLRHNVIIRFNELI